MSDCQSCEREHICAYQFKPCDCIGYRKFVGVPTIYCGDCNGSGWSPYPIKCKACKGSGLLAAKAKGE